MCFILWGMKGLHLDYCQMNIKSRNINTKEKSYMQLVASNLGGKKIKLKDM